MFDEDVWVKFVKVQKGRLQLTSNSIEFLDYVKRQFTIPNPMAGRHNWATDELTCISPIYSFKEGMAFDIIKSIRAYNIDIQIDITEVKDILVPMSMKEFELIQPENEKIRYYDYQEDAINRAMKNGRGCFVFATGSGKSLIQYGIIKNVTHNTKVNRTLILVPNVDLLTQMADEFVSEYGCNPEDICKYATKTNGGTDVIGDQPIIITNRQYLDKGKRWGNLPKDIGLLLIDECIRKNTLITTKDGKRKIQDIKTGDIVLSYNIDKSRYEYKKVLKTHENLPKSNSYDHFLQIELENGKILDVTPNHKIYTNNRGYVRADELTEEDDIIFMKIKKISKIPRNYERVYNLTVEDNHNYIANDILVSNCHGLSNGSQLVKNVIKLNIKKCFGFTGTESDWRLSEWDMKGVCGRVLKVIRAGYLQERGFLAQSKIVSIQFEHTKKFVMPPEEQELLEIAKKNYQEDTSKENWILLEKVKQEVNKIWFPMEWHYIEENDFINNFIVKCMYKFSGNTIVLFDHIAHGEKLYKQLEQRNIEMGSPRRIYYIDGKIPVKYRKQVRKEMELYDNCVLVGNTKCVGTGINIKNIDNIGFAFSSGKAVVKIIQAIGRGLRKKVGKKRVLIVDFNHSLRYSKKHFAHRLGLYKIHYNITKDGIISKTVKVPKWFEKTDINKL